MYTHIRQGHIIKCIETGEVQDFKTINAAKRASREMPQGAVHVDHGHKKKFPHLQLFNHKLCRRYKG